VSRIGKEPITVPSGVDVAILDGTVTVKGPRGELSRPVPGAITVRQEGGVLLVERPDDERESRSLHGLTRSLVANMVQGVTTGYTKKLEIVGVGYQAQLKKANTVALQVGYANQVVLEAPTGVSVTVPDATHVVISGADKQAVGQFAAVVRKVRPPEPYKGKGIRYEGETVRRKAGKAFGSK
jgi:large subunit ribosomal protein L6